MRNLRSAGEDRGFRCSPRGHPFHCSLVAGLETLGNCWETLRDDLSGNEARVQERAAADVIAGRVEAARGQRLAANPQFVHSPGASIGVAVFPEDGQDTQSLVEMADRLMYQDKRGRRADNELFGMAVAERIR